MSYLSNIYINITMLGVSLIFMIILLSGILLQKMDAPTTKALTVMSGMEVFILIGQISQWVLYGFALGGRGSATTGIIDGILFCLDFSLMNFSLITFYRFIQIHIDDTGKRNGVNIKLSEGFFTFMIIWGVLISVIYILFACSQVIFFFDDSGIPHAGNLRIYTILARSNLLIYGACLYIVIKYRKILGLSYCLILLSFLVVRFIAIPMDLTHSTSFSYIAFAMEIFILYLGIDRRRTNDLLIQQVEIAEQKVDLEEKNTRIMLSQIQPHFLYNTLSVIDYLCGKDPDRARLAITTFSDYLRMNMESIGTNTPIPFKTEFEHTKAYLWIEELRFSDILTVKYDIAVDDFVIPPLSLQPLVENAVKHGVRGKEEGGTVIISTRRLGNTIYISVADDGMGFDTLKTPDDSQIHLGIENVRSRLNIICNGELEISSTPGVGTLATIIIPEYSDT